MSVRSELESTVLRDLGRGLGVDQETVSVLESGSSAQVSPCRSDEFALEVSSRLHVPAINPGCVWSRLG